MQVRGTQEQHRAHTMRQKKKKSKKGFLELKMRWNTKKIPCKITCNISNSSN